MIYKGTFRNIDDELIDISITTKGSQSEVTELSLASDPVTISSVSNGLFSPIKADSATIRILTEKIYADMYSSSLNQSEVVIRNSTKGKTLFRGYLTPNIYTQDYVGIDNLELEAVSALSALKNIKYKRSAEIVCWYDLIKNALLKVGYTSFYLSRSYQLSKTNNESMLKRLYQFEGNFFDNDDEKTPWTYYSILEEFCKYFCLSLVVFESEIYFIDYKNLRDFEKHNLTNNGISAVRFNKNYTIAADSHKDAGTKISYDETFNKISVKDNLYEMDNLIDDPMDDLVNQNSDKNKFYEQQEKLEGVDYTYLNAFFKSGKWTNLQGPGEITPSNIKSLGYGSFWQKAESYPTEEEPSSLNWQSYLTACNNGVGFNKGLQFMITKPKEQKDLICNGGYFVINMDYKLSNSLYANDCFKTSDQKYSTDKYSVAIKDTSFPCKLYIGDYFYDGEFWIKKSEFDRKKAKGYYKSVAVMTQNPIPTWYKYRNRDGDWKFCNKSEWDSATTEKESGKSDDSNKVLYYSENGQRIYVDEQFYNECILQDRFYLVHKNKKDDKIFDERKSLTNTVSWRMNIVDSEDGVAIKLPQFLLTGKLTFELYSPDVLGNEPQHRTDQETKIATAVHISRFEMLYKVSGNSVDIFDGAAQEDDVIYTNVINEDFVNEWDDLEIKINTQVEDRITSLSSVLLKPAGSTSYRFLDKTYDKVNDSQRTQEESIISRYYSHYSSPKLILESTLENKLTPLTVVKESNLAKSFVVDCYEINLADNTANVKLIEY